MSKPFYSPCVMHCMRFYARYPNMTHFKSTANKNDWTACYKALQHYTETERKVLMMVYGGTDTLADNVYQTSLAMKIDQDLIWDMLPNFERMVARKRGLI